MVENKSVEKPKRQRTQKQIDAFEKARAKRSENLANKKKPPELTKEEYAKKNGIKGSAVKGQYNTRFETLTWHNKEKGTSGSYTAEVYVFDKNLIEERLTPEISADIDTMFDREVGGPDAAIALFNETFTDKNTGSYLVTEEDIKKYPWLTKDGKIDYLAGIPSENDFGSEGSIYDVDGKLKPDVKKLYQKIYMDHYIRENVRPKMDNIEVPGTALGAEGVSSEDQIAKSAARIKLQEKRDEANQKYTP